MKVFLFSLFLISWAQATELIYVSNDISQSNLNSLESTYMQKLLINDKRVYLIPSDCRLERYFGGASEGKVNLSKAPERTEEILLTQEVFEEQDETEIIEQLEVEKSISLVEGKVSKAFLDDEDGRGFGGSSEVPLDFTFQKAKATSSNMKPEKKQKKLVVKAKAYQHPQCKLTKDGSAYELLFIQEAQFYEKGVFYKITKTSIQLD